jgi:Coenzyme PQQ synthesis protein D (PqqD)
MPLVPARSPGAVSAAATVGPHEPSVLEREVRECFALLHPNGREVLILNATASDIWRLSDGELTMDGIVDVLATAYGVPAQAIRDEVERTVSTLRDSGFLSCCRR